MADRRQCKVQKLQNQVHGPASHALPAKEIVIQESDFWVILNVALGGTAFSNKSTTIILQNRWLPTYLGQWESWKKWKSRICVIKTTTIGVSVSKKNFQIIILLNSNLILLFCSVFHN